MKEEKKYYLLLEKISGLILIFLVTFPKIDPSYSIGLDSSYAWAFNYLFHNDYGALKELVYPYGVLGFLKMPTTEGYNLAYFLLFYTVLKIWFIISFLKLATKITPYRKNLPVFVVIGMLFLLSTEYLILGLCVIQCIMYIETKILWNIFFATAVAFVGFCIKSSIGISAFSMIFMAFLINFYLKRNRVDAIKFIGVVFITIGSFEVLIFHDFTSFYHYVLNVIKLSANYSTALSLFPSNNWWLLGGFLGTIFMFPFIAKNKRNAQIIFLLFLPSLFAMWKHAMSREDISHNTVLLYYLFLFWGIVIIYSRIKTRKILIIAAINISLFYSNMSNFPNFKGRSIEINGINHFRETVLNYSSFKKKYTALSKKNIQANKLKIKAIKLIEDSSIDIYPWELSYIPANNFNWKSRTTLQGGAYSHWHDSISALSFNKQNGASFVLFHFVKDKWNGGFGSIDNRYLLNDNPLTIYNIFNNYTVKLKTNKYLLFKKNKRNNFLNVKYGKIKSIKWDSWINVKHSSSEILRLKVFSEVSLIGKIRNLLYKSEEYSIDYMFGNGKILSYRYIPENAKDGIWINPFIQFPATNQVEQNVIKVRFRSSSSIYNNPLIKYQFEQIQMDTTHYLENERINIANYLFLKTKLNTDSVLINLTNKFETPIYKKQNNILSKQNLSFSGYYANKIASEHYSYCFEFSLDSLWKNLDSTINNITIESDLYYLNATSKANFVITTSESKNDFWNAVQLKKTTEKGRWEYIFFSKTLNRQNSNSGKLKIYVWNNSQKKMFIDNFSVVIKAIDGKK